jgi:DUF1680 family protein
MLLARRIAPALFIAASLMLLPETIAAKPVAPVVPYEARPLPLSAVRLTGGPLHLAQELDAEYLLKLEPDRIVFFLRKRAGLETKANQGYGGWDGDGRQLTGHICGHYLSAVSLMYAATGDARFKGRADYIVKELKEIQDKHGDGYIGGLMGNARPPQRGGGGGGDRGQTNELVDGKILFHQLAEGTINSGGFDLNGMWSPWYVQHKLYAGLRDASRYTGNRMALSVEIKFAEWADNILSRLTDDQIQRMLSTEFGAMNEMMIDLYADTGDRRWLKAADYFQHRAIVDPLARHEDILPGKHGNTQVPKLLGSLVRYLYTGESRDGFAASFMWDRVVNHHTFATGGHGRNEYFGPPDKLNDLVDGRTAETCNVYNMLKMTRKLFALWPDAHYADFHERALFNHILGSMDPTNGSTCYMVCVGQSPRQREYADMFQSFTCCVGSGMESHALHGDGIYYESGDRLWVNLYAPSTAEWKSGGVKLAMETDFPEGESARLKLTLKSPKQFTLALRRPFWAGEGFAVKVNGDAASEEIINPGRGENPGGRGGFGRGQGRRGYALPRKTSSYVELNRTWRSGDTVEFVLPKSLRLEPLPDNPRRAAVTWGPLVLAGDLGPERPRGRGRESRSASTNNVAVPVFIAAEKPVTDWLKPVPDKPGHFRSDGVGRDRDVEFVPFYRLHRRTYGVYWNLFTPGEWEKKAAEHLAAQEKLRKLEAATVAFAQPGEMQPERDFNFQGEDSSPVRVMDRPARRGSKWFSFDLPVDMARPMALIVTYCNDEQQTRSFEIFADGKGVGQQTIERRSPEQVIRFFDVEYSIPAVVVKDKQKVTVRFQATDGNEIAAVFGLRMIRADAER